MIARLRDRPPRYVREVPAAPSSPTTYATGEPPPAYEGANDADTVQELPPAYSIAVISTSAFDPINSSTITNDSSTSRIIPLVAPEADATMKVVEVKGLVPTNKAKEPSETS